MNDAAGPAETPDGTAAAAHGAAAQPARVTLDLALHPDDATAFWRAPPVLALRGGARPRTRPIALTWHDGAERPLIAAGLVLAQLRQGSQSTWRLESASAAERLPGLAPKLLRDAASPAELGPELPPHLVALASFDGVCRSLPLPEAGPIEALSLLDGALRDGGGRARPACRLLLSGTPRDVFSLARALAGDLRLMPPQLGLLDDALQAAPSCPPVLLHAGPGRTAVGDALAAVIAQLDTALLHWAALVGTADGPEPVHQMRVAVRRLRSVLNVFGDALGSPQLDEAAHRLRDLAAALGQARDWDVFVHGVGREAAEAAEALGGDPVMARLMAAAERRRQECYARLRAVLDDPTFRVLALCLTELAATRPWAWTPASSGGAVPPDDLAAFARQALTHRLRKTLRSGTGFAERSAADLHALRLRCKRLRYAGEMFAPLFPGRGARRFLHRLARVQDQLGLLNDAAVAATLMQQLGGFRGRATAIGLVRGYAMARAAGGRAAAARRWSRFRRCDPFWT